MGGRLRGPPHRVRPFKARQWQRVLASRQSARGTVSGSHQDVASCCMLCIAACPSAFVMRRSTAALTLSSSTFEQTLRVTCGHGGKVAVRCSV